jgi:hypothetical protein
MWISKKLGIYLKTWQICKEAPLHPLVGTTRWSNKSLKGTSFYQRPEWVRNFWVARRMFCISRNCA